MSGRLLLESGTYGYLLEDSSGVLLLENTGLRLDVAGRDLLSDLFISGEPTVTNTAYRQCGTMTFRVEGAPGTFSIVAENPVIFHHFATGAIYYAGFVKTVTPVAGECTPGWRVLDIECQDYTVLPGMSVITAEPDPTGLTDKQFITAVFGLYDTKGIVIGTECQVVATSVLSESEANFLGDTLSEFMDELCAATGASWYVDYSKHLHYFVTESEAAPFDVSMDGGDGVTTFMISNLSLPEDSIDLKNCVLYIPGTGGDAVPTWYEDPVSIAATAAACGDNGRREACERDDRITVQATLDSYGAAFLAANAKKHPGSFTCYEPGLRAGMWINITSADDGLSAAPFAIVSVTTRLVQAGATLADSYVVFDVEIGDRPATLGGTMAKTAVKAVPVQAQIDGSLTNQIALDFANRLVGIPIVNDLPTLPDAAFPSGFKIVLTTDRMLYISDGTDWNVDSDGSHLYAGSFEAAAAAFTVVVAKVANVGDTVLIDSSGIAVTGGRISVKNSGGTVIIDGTSDMLKVAATATCTWPAAAHATEATTTISLSLGLAQTPMVTGYIGGGSGMARTCPWVLMVANTDSAGGVMEIYSQNSGTTTHVKLHTANLDYGGGIPATDGRYYVFVEAAL